MKKYIVQHLRAGMDRNGNSRNGIVIYNNPADGAELGGSIHRVRYSSEGFHGALSAAGITIEDCIVMPEIEVTARELRYQLA